METSMFVSAFLIILIIIYTLKRRGKKYVLPPGPRGLPFLGNLLDMDVNNLPQIYFRWAKKFGPIFLTRFGSLKIVVINDPSLLKEAFSKDAFSPRPKLWTSDLRKKLNEGTSGESSRRILISHSEIMITIIWIMTNVSTYVMVNIQNLKIWSNFDCVAEVALPLVFVNYVSMLPYIEQEQLSPLFRMMKAALRNYLLCQKKAKDPCLELELCFTYSNKSCWSHISIFHKIGRC